METVAETIRWCLVHTNTGRLGPFGATSYGQYALDQKAAVAGPEWEIRTDHPDEVDPNVTYFDGSNYISRPVTPEPTGSVYDLTSLPTGTQVTVTNEAGDQMIITDLELDETLTLTDPGTYTFEVIPPFPWTEVRKQVEIS